MQRFSARHGLIVLTLTLGVVCTHASAVLAQDTEQLAREIASEELAATALATDPAERLDGWYFRLIIGASGALSHSENVVGNIDGLTMALGALVDGGAEFVAGQHEWHTSLNIEHQQTQTPVVDGFIKSIDNLQLATLYLYRIKAVPWLGPYVRTRLRTSLFDGYTRLPDDRLIVRTPLEGAPSAEFVEAGEKVTLTGPFEPLIIYESTGLFAEPLRSKALTFKSKVGIGGQHILVRDGYAVTDDEDTPELELTELQSSNAFGAELELQLIGAIADNVTWALLANFFYPFVDSYDGDLEGEELMHTELAMTTSVALASWLSLDYGLGVRRLPFVIDEWQISNQLLLKAAYSLF